MTTLTRPSHTSSKLISIFAGAGLFIASVLLAHELWPQGTQSKTRTIPQETKRSTPQASIASQRVEQPKSYSSSRKTDTPRNEASARLFDIMMGQSLPRDEVRKRVIAELRKTGATSEVWAATAAQTIDRLVSLSVRDLHAPQVLDHACYSGGCYAWISFENEREAQEYMDSMDAEDLLRKWGGSFGRTGSETQPSGRVSSVWLFPRPERR